MCVCVRTYNIIYIIYINILYSSSRVGGWPWPLCVSLARSSRWSWIRLSLSPPPPPPFSLRCSLSARVYSPRPRPSRCPSATVARQSGASDKTTSTPNPKLGRVIYHYRIIIISTYRILWRSRARISLTTDCSRRNSVCKDAIPSWFGPLKLPDGG